ncbi:MAG: VOC family protein [Terriglobales bacterium]
MTASVKPVPEGFHTATPTLIVRNAADAIEFYKKVFDAEERMRMPSPDGKIMHAELKIGDSIIFLSDEFPNMGGKSPQTLGGHSGGVYLYVPDVDDVFQRAIAAGGKSSTPVTDMFWGDRHGNFTDPFGHSWGVSTHTEDVSEEEMGKRAEAFYAEMAQKKSA